LGLLKESCPYTEFILEDLVNTPPGSRLALFGVGKITIITDDNQFKKNGCKSKKKKSVKGLWNC